MELNPSCTIILAGVSLLVFVACGEGQQDESNPEKTNAPISTPSATPRAVLPSPTAEPRCHPPGAEPVGRSPFCVTWRDRYDDELGFLIVLEYGHGPDAEVFRYEVDPDESEFIFPEADSPGDTLETCRGRSGVEVSVRVVRPSSEPEEISNFAGNIGCPRLDPPE